MKPIRLRTALIALVVVSGSAITGVGLGRMLASVAMAAEAPLAGQRATDEQPGVEALANWHRLEFDPRFLPKPPHKLDFTGALGVSQLPLWNYSVVAEQDGNTYTGTVMGRSPFNRGKTATTIPVQIVPLIITINDGSTTITYDPTVVDPCVPGSHTVVDVVTNSPIFTNNNWTLNGVPVGNTQYIDAFQRAEFWTKVGGSNYHLNLKPTVLGAQKISFSSGVNLDSGPSGFCGFVGGVQIGDLDAAIQGLLAGPLNGVVNPGTVPIFITKNIGYFIGNQCCALGYHGTNGSLPNIQVYSPFCLDTSGFWFSGYTSVLSHEMGEAVNDPTGGNPTPLWGNIGQVGGCQGNLEVADPLSGTDIFLLGANGLNYSLQEMAFYSWFYGGPSLGTGGKYSSNSTFGGPAKLCPPGGTN